MSHSIESLHPALEHRYVAVGSRQLHALVGGRGVPILLLHAPGEEAGLIGGLPALAAGAGVIAADLPGHGWSDGYGDGAYALDAIVADLHALLDALDVGALVVGTYDESITVGRALADRLGARVRRLVCIDAVEADPRAHGVGTWDERPEPSGAHLFRAWDRIRDRSMFLPSWEHTSRARVQRDMPHPPVLTRRLLSRCRAGSARIALIQACSTRGGVPVRSPQGEVWLSGGSGAHDLLESATRVSAPDWHPPAAVDSPAGSGLRRHWIRVDGGWLHAQVSAAGSARPLLGLHDPAGTSALLVPFVAPLADSRPLVLLDLPGNGGSEDVLGTPSASSTDYARVVLRALETLGVDSVDVVGRYSGGPIGMELAFMQPGLVRHLVQAGITTYGAEESRRLLESYTPPLGLNAHGGHLALAWHMMKSQALFWPWFEQTRSGIIAAEPQLDPALIHQRVVDLLTCGDLYRRAYAALWTYPLAQRLPMLSIPTLLCAPPWDPLHDHLVRAVTAAGPSAVVSTLPPRFGDWIQVIAPFLDDRPDASILTREAWLAARDAPADLPAATLPARVPHDYHRFH